MLNGQIKKSSFVLNNTITIFFIFSVNTIIHNIP